jgi:ribosomal protein S18 acetylase RimI-like enzyme
MQVAGESIVRANISNLTALWRAFGTVGVEAEQPLVATRSASWPHRCWFEMHGGDSALAAVAGVLDRLPAGFIVPVWDGPQAASLETLLAAQGYRETFRQTAMSLRLEDYRRHRGAAPASTDPARLVLQRLDSIESVLTWCGVGSEAFGYCIDPEAIADALATPGLELYLGLIGGEAVATGLLLQTGEVVGIHQVGVSGAVRGLGLARELMHRLLERSVDCGASCVTLQASEAGAPLYRSMHFDELFTIRNYVREG